MTDAERKFKALAEGGSVNRPFGKTFFSKGFGMCVDQFGFPWMVSCPASSAGVEALRRGHRRAARRNCNTHQKIPEERRHLLRSEDADFARHRYVSDRQRDRAELEMEMSGASYLIRRHANVLSLLMASLAVSEQARAACDPTSPVSDRTVTCTGTTLNANGNNGYGTAADAGNIYNVLSGASVTGTEAGLIFSTGTVNTSGTISATGGTIGIGIGANSATVTNSGTISGTGTSVGAGISANSATVTSSGTISGAGGANGSGFGISANSATVTSSGTISGAAGADGSGFGIFATNATVINSGTFSGTAGANGSGFGIFATSATVTNSGTISGTASGAAGAGFGITATNATVTNSGTISGTGSTNGRGIDAENATVINSGTISGTANRAGRGIVAVSAIVTNSGTISGTGGGATGFGFGIDAVTSAIVTNSGTISGTGSGATGFGIGIHAVTSAIVTNSGTISGTGGPTGIGIVASSAPVTNSGTISGTGTSDGFGISADSATVTSSGTISGAGATNGRGIVAENVTVTNSGTISGTAGANGSGVGIFAINATVINSGTISGSGGAGGVGVGIFVGATGNIANSGTIIGSSGTAIQFNALGTAASDILTVLPGARFGGLVDFGGGADTVNFGPGSWILNTAKFDAGLSRVNTSGNPFVVTPTQIIVADLSGFGAQNRAILDITGWIGAVLPDTPVFAPGARGGASAFAAIDTATSPFDAFAGFPQSALGYAEAAKAPVLKAASAVYADGNAVWAKGFGGQRVQDTNGAFIGGTTTGAGGAIGYERMIDPDLKVGALVGGSTNKTNLYLNAGSTSTDTVFGGAYGRKMWGGSFLDLAVIGGNLANTNVRNIGGGLGLASANASYGGWFINPSLAFGHRFDVDLHGNFTITPAVKVRYVDAHFDGYTETGAGAADLVVAGRDFQAWEERVELALANTFTVGSGHRVMVRVTGGVLAQQRSAGGQVNIALLGQNFLAATPDRGSIAGAFGGAGLDWQIGNVTLFASGEATGTNDSTRSYAAKGGARMSW